MCVYHIHSCINKINDRNDRGRVGGRKKDYFVSIRSFHYLSSITVLLESGLGSGFFVCFFFFVVQGLNPGPQCLVGKRSTGLSYAPIL
jgi:hypothetical protein